MDKEAQEKIAIRLHSTERSLLRVVNEVSPCNCMWDDLAEEWKGHYRINAFWFLSDILELGYRKPPEGEPPLLSDEEMDLIILDPDKINTPEVYYNLCKAQKDSDIKWYDLLSRVKEGNMKRVCLACYQKACAYQSPEITLRFLALYPEAITEDANECNFHGSEEYYDAIGSEILMWIFDALEYNRPPA